MFPCNNVLPAFEAAGRRLEALPSSTQTLVLAIVAMTARITAHPALLGPGSLAPELSAFFDEPMRIVEVGPDDGVSSPSPPSSPSSPYSVGCRREGPCEKLRRRALERAWAQHLPRAALPCPYVGKNGKQQDSQVDAEAEALATCFLLRWIEHPPYCDSCDTETERAVWGAAFVSHLRRSQANCTSHGQEWKDDKRPLSLETLRWIVQFMRETVAAAAWGDSCSFTLNDEVMLAGPPPPSPQEVLANANTLCDAQWWDTQMFWALVRPFTYTITQMALNSFDWASRRRANLPFSMSRLREHMAALNPLYALLALAHARFSVAFSTEAAAMRLCTRPTYYSATANGVNGGSHSAQRQTEAHAREKLERGTARFVLGAMTNALANVCIPLYADVEGRLMLASEKAQVGAGDGSETLKALMGGLKRALLPYARRIVLDKAESVHGGDRDGMGKGAKSLAAFAQIGDEPSRFWTRFILSATPIEDGGEAITRAQKLQLLESLYKTLKVMSWAWPRLLEEPTALRVKAGMEMLRLEQTFDEIYGLAPVEGSIVPIPTGVDYRSSQSQDGLLTNLAGSRFKSPATSASTSTGSTSSSSSDSAGCSSGGSALFDLPDIEAVVRSTGVLCGETNATRSSPGLRSDVTDMTSGIVIAGADDIGIMHGPDLPWVPAGSTEDGFAPAMELPSYPDQTFSMFSCFLPGTYQGWQGF